MGQRKLEFKPKGLLHSYLTVSLCPPTNKEVQEGYLWKFSEEKMGRNQERPEELSDSHAGLTPAKNKGMK